MKARADSDTWSTGFVVGARGEVVFGIETAPTTELVVETTDGRREKGHILGFDRTMSLAVGIFEGLKRVPLRGGPNAVLDKEQWVVILGYDQAGNAEPHAGVIAVRPKRGPDGHVCAVAEVPGAPGGPILSTDGQLVGIAVSRGKRRVRLVPLSYVAPFLERVVLGGKPH